MKNNWLTIENQDGEVVLTKCSEDAKGEIVIPDGVTSIEEDAFINCRGLISVVIPNSVRFIGGGAFLGCMGLTSIFIPRNVERIGECAFADCFGLTSIVVDPENKHFDSRNNCNAIIETAENMIIADCKNMIIPKDVTRICVSGYRDCIFELKQKDGDICLEGCPENISLSVGDTVIIPNSITSIAPSAFGFVYEVKTIIIPNSVKNIRDEAFRNCDDLESIIIPDSVTMIGKGIISGCSKLKAIIVSSGNHIYDSRSDCNAIVETASNKLIAGCPKTSIPDSVKCIAQGAFDEIDLPLFVVPESVEVIESDAFGGCYGNIFIPESLANSDIDSSGNCKICAYKTIK